MEKRILLFGLAALLMSCGGNKSKEFTVTPETTEIDGPLQGCYEVVQKDYTIKKGASSVIDVELKRTDKELPFDPQEATNILSLSASKPVKIGFGIELLDEDGEVVASEDASGSLYSSSDIDEVIQLGSGEAGVVRCSVDVEDKPATFRITSDVDRLTVIEVSPSADGASSENSSSNDWDSVLDKYESYVNRYIATFEKAMNGDLSAASEYVNLMEEAEDLGDALDDATDEMTPAQLSRYARITTKLSNMASEAADF